MAERGFIHRNPRALDRLAALPAGGETTMGELLVNSFRQHSAAPCLATRVRNADGSAGPFEWQTYRQIQSTGAGVFFCTRFTPLEAKVEQFASGLSELGLKRGERLGCYSPNREEAVLAELSAWLRAFCTVYLYDTLGSDSAQYITNHAEISMLVCSPEKADRVVELAKQCPKLRAVIVMGTRFASTIEGHLRLISVDEVMQLGAEALKNGAHPSVMPQLPKADEMMTILYTSGTTGPPKGVVITHANFVAAIAAAQKVTSVRADDVLLSYLPMAHVFEKVLQGLVFSSGSRMGFSRGDPKLLIDDVLALRPTVFCGVPRVFQKVYDRVQDQVATSSWARRKLFEHCYATKRDAHRAHTPQVVPWWMDAVVFSKIKERLGGRVRLILSGAAPLSAELHEFLEICFCAPVVQGYGLSETCAVTSVPDESLWGRAEGHVGFPCPENEIVLESVPEMAYTVHDHPFPRGEILIRGPNVFSGYYREPEKTAEVFTADGFFRTGDIGQWNENGTLSIIDRKKNIFKLAQGEYVAVEKLEQIYVRSPYVAQVWVYGNSERDSLVAVVVPDAEVMLRWAKSSNLATVCASKEAEAVVFHDFQRLASESKLAGFERIARIHLEPIEWTPDSGDFMTPTMKTKRPQMLKHYQHVVDNLYADLAPAHLKPKAKL